MYSFESAKGTFRLVYEWFAGWRWELWLDGVLVDEALRSFERAEECASDALSRATGGAPA